MCLFQEMMGSRREFFRAAARYTLLATFGIAGYFSARKTKLKGQSCIRQGICNDCIQFADCGLPAALSRKQTQKERKS